MIRKSLKQIRAMKRNNEIHSALRTTTTQHEVPKDFWKNAKPFKAPNKISVHLRLDSDVFDWFKSQGSGHLTHMNSVLRSYYEAQQLKKKD